MIHHTVFLEIASIWRSAANTLIQKAGQNKSPQHCLFFALDYISKNIFKIGKVKHALKPIKVSQETEVACCFSLQERNLFI